MAKSGLRRVVGKRLVLPVAVACAAFVAPATSRASDHIDGLKTAIDNAADMTDLYVFTSPRDANKLVFVMNTHPIAFSGSRFSNAVDYKFRIRPIEDTRTLAPSRDARKEQSIVCSFANGFFVSGFRNGEPSACSVRTATMIPTRPA